MEYLFIPRTLYIPYKNIEMMTILISPHLMRKLSLLSMHGKIVQEANTLKKVLMF